MLVKAIVVVFFIIILYALGSALYYLVRDKKNDDMRFVKALAWRIGLSITLFLLLLAAYGLGWIKPHGL
jgi:4-hydroxybenzoate polyprenyltransferase